MHCGRHVGVQLALKLENALARNADELRRKIAETLAESQARDVQRVAWRTEAAEKGLDYVRFCGGHL